MNLQDELFNYCWAWVSGGVGLGLGLVLIVEGMGVGLGMVFLFHLYGRHFHSRKKTVYKKNAMLW